MPENHTYRIEDFVADLTRVSFSDILVNVKEDSKSIFKLDWQGEDQLEIPFNSRLNQLYKLAVQNKKTADIQSLCLAQELVSWKYKEAIVSTPLLLVPVHVSFNKIKQCFYIRLEKEAAFVNPFLVNVLAHEYQISPEPSDEKTAAEQLLYELDKHEFHYEIIPFQALGNFHHHRYEIIRDLEELISLQEPNELVKLVLGQSAAESDYPLELTTQNCFSSDSDQEAIFKQIESGNCVIQGPPGTGKSQVLSNLLCKLLYRGNMHLLVSEKKTALDVLAQKLKTRALGEFSVVLHAQSQSSDFIKQLRACWRKLEEERFQHKNNLQLSAQQLDRLQLLLDKLNQNELLQQYDLSFFHDFRESELYARLPYVSGLPDLKEWKNLLPSLGTIYAAAKKPALLSVFKPSVLQHYPNLDEHLQELLREIKNLNVHLPFSCFSELEQWIKLSARVQLLENERGKVYFSLIKTPAQLKKYEKLKNEYNVLSERIKLLENESLHWLKVPAKSELESWKHKLQTGNWLEKRKTKTALRKRLAHKNLEPSVVVSNMENLLHWQQQQLDVRSALQQMGVTQPEHELELISYLSQRLQGISKNELNEVEQLDPSLREKLIELVPALKSLEHKLNSFVDLDTKANLSEWLTDLQQALDWILPLKKSLLDLPTSLYKLFRICNTVEEMQATVIKSAWIHFSGLFPELAETNGEKLRANLIQICKTEEHEQTDFAEQILFKHQQQFAAYHQLLSTPSVKLKGDQKELKARLKSGKALLVKEFSKSKQHKSIRELLESDASLWIEVLCPLFLCTPNMVSKNIPLRTGFFECLIFDEASQLILPKALAALQRAKRVVVAGDEQQMSPSSYFSGSLSAVDLLHQAGFYLPNKHLKHHYRSKHKQLIAFSNRHFYNDELIVYPQPFNNSNPAQLHFVEKGIYEERQNTKEAQAVAQHIESCIKLEISLGIVAFSEQQLACIWKHIEPKTQGILEERMRQNTVFMKPLEQVQGEECDLLIISLGYGPNAAGEFHLRFGPLNQKTGIKRLNVLLTRAKEHIDFFSSVHSTDFALTHNEAINLLRLYLHELENETKDEQNRFPFGIEPEINEREMHISKIYKSIPNSLELKTFHELMSQRSWNITYHL